MKEGALYKLDSTGRLFVIMFVLALSFGYATGLKFVSDTSGFKAEGIEENYNGNKHQGEPIEEDGKETSDEDLMSEDFYEDDPEEETIRSSEAIKFKKSEKTILNVIHSHVISFSLIFLVMGYLVFCLKINPFIKKFLVIEPFISIIITFGGIWLMWHGMVWMKYVIMISGILLTLTFFISCAVVFWHMINFGKYASDSR